MNCVGCNIDIVACINLIGEKLDVFFPARNAKRLETDLQFLIAIKDDVEQQIHVQEAQYPGMMRRNQVVAWIERVKTLQIAVERRLRSTASRNRCMKCLCCGYASCNYGLGENVIDFLEQIQQLRTQIKEIGDNLVMEVPEAQFSDQEDVRSELSSEIEGEDDNTDLYSFDVLNDDQIRSCLSYSCLRNEYQNIEVRDLVEYWVGEGLLDGEDRKSIHEARRMGMDLIHKLMSAGLLKTGSKGDRYVNITEAAVGRVLSTTTARRGYVLQADSSVEDMRNLESLDVVSRVFVMHHCSEVPLDEVSTCCNLRTLLLKNNDSLTRIYDGFFPCVQALRVLDLSATMLSGIPSSIGLLAELQYLNLKYTEIQELPIELGNLKKLRQLNLRFTRNLVRIPRQAIRGLLALQVLDMLNCLYSWDQSDSTQLTIPDLGHMTHLEEVGIDVRSITQLLALLRSNLSSSATRWLTLGESQLTAYDVSSRAITELPELQVLQIIRCIQLEQLIFTGSELQKLEELLLAQLHISTIVLKPIGGAHLQNLRRLCIVQCSALRDVKWVRQLPSLHMLILNDCSEMLRVIGGDKKRADGDDELEVDDEQGCAFPKLTEFCVIKLPQLVSISKNQLFLPSLQVLHVEGCPKLKRLPLGPHSGKKLRKIRGDQEWWDNLVWGSNGGVKRKLAKYFSSLASPV